MHLVLGDGEMSKKELTETLKDLWDKAGEEAFWFIVQGKSEPTETDTNLVKWLVTNEVWFEVLTDDADAMDELYSDAQETHVVKRLGQKAVSLLNTKPEEDESADVLALFVSDDSAAEEDRWLNSVLQLVVDAGFKVYGLNDGLVEVDLDGEADTTTEEEEEETVPTPTKRGSVKKAAAAKAAAPAKAKSYTKDDLEEMELDELKKIAGDKGIELPPRTRHATYIAAILGEDSKDAPAVEVTSPPVTKTVESSNGDIDEVVEQVLEIVIEKLVKALQA